MKYAKNSIGMATMIHPYHTTFIIPFYKAKALYITYDFHFIPYFYIILRRARRGYYRKVFKE